MRAHKSRVTVTDEHEVVVRLPSDFPAGDADVFVIANDNTESDTAREPFDQWLQALLQRLPQAATVPLEALRRENLYD